MTARYAGKRGLAAKMAAAVLVHQDHSIARAAGVAAALMLERVILGQSIAVSAWSMAPHMPGAVAQKVEGG